MLLTIDLPNCVLFPFFQDQFCHVDEILLSKLNLNGFFDQTRSSLCNIVEIDYSTYPNATEIFKDQYTGEQKDWNVLMLTGLAAFSLKNASAFYHGWTKDPFEYEKMILFIAPRN